MSNNQITIASQGLARRLAQARGEIDYYAPQGGGSRQPAVVTTTREERQEITTTRQSQLARLLGSEILFSRFRTQKEKQTMSNITISSNTLANLRNASHIVINIPTDRRLSHNESEQLCDAVESAFAQKGMNVRAAGGTNFGTSIAIDVYKRG